MLLEASYMIFIIPGITYDRNIYQGILKEEVIDLLFDWFGLECFANKNKKSSVVIQLIPNQSNRRSMVQ